MNKERHLLIYYPKMAVVTKTCYTKLIQAQQLFMFAPKVEGYKENVSKYYQSLLMSSLVSRMLRHRLESFDSRNQGLLNLGLESIELLALPRPCLQYKFDHRVKETPWISSISSSEDCLYLNIWSTGHNRSSASRNVGGRKPVLIWIHGGGYTTGSSDVDNYDGAVLAAFGDMIVVTINYRLGIFGFLNVKHETAPGNQGLHDQALAIKWVVG